MLGQLRNDLGRPPVHEGPYRFVWVVDFPLFVGVDEATGRPKPGHHPFTRPHPDDVDQLETDPLRGAQPRPTTSCSTAGSSARARSGSTSPSCSSGSSTCSASATRRPTGASGSSSTPFRYGAPPHGGFAFGIDRLVAILAGEENIREVIAFPKTQSGTDPMTGAPTPVAPAQLGRARPAHPAADRPDGRATPSP